MIILMNDLMNLKGKLHQSRLVFLHNMNKIYIHSTTVQYTINTLQETNNAITKIHDTTKITNDNATIKLTNIQPFI